MGGGGGRNWGGGAMNGGTSTRAALARLRQFILDGRVASGLIAGALFGMLVRELGVWSIRSWDNYSMAGVIGFAVLGAIGGRFALVSRVLWIADVVLLAFVLTIALTAVTYEPAHRWIRSDSLPPTGL